MIPAVLFGSAHLAPYLRTVPPWATVLSSMFLHGVGFHLIGNMLFLWIFGNNAEDTLGHTRYMFLYLASGIAAALVGAARRPGTYVAMISPGGPRAGVLRGFLVLCPPAYVPVFMRIVSF